MGEVYRARDTKLGREVAIKVLLSAVANDPDRLARFSREAHVLASLNHPNIAQIHGVEDADGVRALVMELVEGPTLADRIATGPIPLDEALPIACQIAEALEAAHEQGIIHRDLKPANIKVRSDGTVKILDFGLAKAMDATASQADVSQSPTITTPAMTQAGIILGTAAYMSPEQAKARIVDKRSDLWSFGCVFYEMLTGQRAFAGDDVSDTLAAVLRGEPNWTALPPNTPEPIRKLLRRCLEKDRTKRLADAADARLEIDDALTASTVAVTRGGAIVQPVAWRQVLVWTVASLLLVGLGTISFIHVRETPTAPERSVRFQIPPPDQTIFSTFKLSPDGRSLAFTAIGASQRTQLWVRALDAVEAKALPATDGASYPFWSPDSRSLAFFAEGKLKKIALAGGPPVTLCEAVNGRGGAWNSTGLIIFSPTLINGLARVSDAGGVATPVTNIPPGSSDSDRFPAFLPDGRRFLFLRLPTGQPDATTGIFVGSVDGTPPVRLLPDTSSATFVGPSGDGYLLFRRDSVLLAQPFDSVRLQNTGGIFPLAEHVGVAGNTGSAAFSAAENDTLAYFSGSPIAMRELVWLDRSGRRLTVVAKRDQFGSLSLSPDGQTLASDVGDGTAETSDVWLRNLARGTVSRFTRGLGGSGYPIWSPDNRWILFTSDGTHSLSRKFASGAGTADAVLLYSGNQNVFASDWSPDGKSVVYTETAPNTKDDLWLLPMDGDRKPQVIVRTPGNDGQGQFSPDGHWMAYTSDDSGESQVYVQSIPSTGRKWQVSPMGGAQPRWRRDGKELFYRSLGGTLMAVPVAGGSELQPGNASALFESAPTITGQVRSVRDFTYSPAADGQRFLMLLPAEAAPAAPGITVVTNWMAGLKK